MCDFIYYWWFIYNGYYMMGMGEKTPKNTKNEYENKGKIPRLVALPSPRL